MLIEVLPDPRAFLTDIEALPKRVLQIHRPIPARVPVGHFEEDGTEVVDEIVDRSEYLNRIQQSCSQLGDRLEVRFYDHFDDVFDASVLDHLNQIRCLAIDGLPIVQNAEAVGRLPRLVSLRFGPRRAGDSRVLTALGVHRLADFTLAGTPEPLVDLSPFSTARALRSLCLLGHGKNTEAIGSVTSLTALAIQPSAKVSLDFISQLINLDTLKLVLGSAKTITAIGELPTLRDLSIREVRNLEDLGDLQRFPQLRRLQVSDQPRITRMQLGHRNAWLEHLYLYSLPRLDTLEGLPDLPALKSLFAYDSQLTPTRPALPRTLTHFQLVTRSVKGRQAHDAMVRDWGLVPAVHPDAAFFYK